MNSDRILKVIKKIISLRSHFIMKKSLYGGDKYIFNNDYELKRVDNLSELIDGTYSIELQKRIISNNEGKCETYICKDVKTNKRIGILSVMYKGGNELEYRIRKVDVFIYNLMVVQEYRGMGIAREMIEALGEIMKSKSFNEMYLAVSKDNLSAIKAYNKAGFIIESEKKFIRFIMHNIPYHIL